MPSIRGRRGFFAVMLAVTLGGIASASGPVQIAPSSDPKDISGTWFGVGNQDPANARFVPVEGGEPPFNAAGRAILDHRNALNAAGHPERQPADECMPHGLPAALRLPTPFEIIQTPGQTTILTEASRTVRTVVMDKPHPAQVERRFMGNSVGHWEGDTLVVDTTAMRANWLDISGAPASNTRHVIERYRKIDGNKKLEVLITIDDPVYYTRSWTARREYLWYPAERVREYICEEGARLEPGVERLRYRDE